MGCSGDWRGQGPLRSGADVGVHVRLGQLAFGRDYWWNSADDADPVEVAETVGVSRALRTAVVRPGRGQDVAQRHRATKLRGASHSLVELPCAMGGLARDPPRW